MAFVCRAREDGITGLPRVLFRLIRVKVMHTELGTRAAPFLTSLGQQAVTLGVLGALEKLLRGCRALQFLACAHCGRLTDDGIRRVRPDSCQWAELNQVSFRSCQGLGPAACQEIGTRWPLLRKVDLGGLPGLDAALFRAHGWEETRCQQFYRTNAPLPATETGSGSSSASARPKRSFEELAAEDDTDLWD